MFVPARDRFLAIARGRAHVGVLAVHASGLKQASLLEISFRPSVCETAEEI